MSGQKAGLVLVEEVFYSSFCKALRYSKAFLVEN